MANPTRGDPETDRAETDAGASMNAEELNDYGHLATVAEWVPRPQGGGREATVFYLNKDQALIVAMLSRAPGAAEVRKRLTRAFDASVAALFGLRARVRARFLIAKPDSETSQAAVQGGPQHRISNLRTDPGLTRLSFGAAWFAPWLDPLRARQEGPRLPPWGLGLVR